MKQAKTAMYIQTFYMFSMGLGILLMPQFLLPLFGFTPPEEVWVRVLGALILGTGYTNFELTRQEVVPYFWHRSKAASSSAPFWSFLVC